MFLREGKREIVVRSEIRSPPDLHFRLQDLTSGIYCLFRLIWQGSPPLISVKTEKQAGKMDINPIGTIHTPFMKKEGMPIQPAGAEGVSGTIDIFEEYRPGLKDLAGFSHIVVLFVFHRSVGYKLQVIPFMDTEERGVFATRAPRRPNPIGLSVVRLDRIEDGVLHVKNVDMLDGTPLLDIKPYVPEFDWREDIRTGWLEEARKTVGRRKSDERFS